jgi:hypothetical protein
VRSRKATLFMCGGAAIVALVISAGPTAAQDAAKQLATIERLDPSIEHIVVGGEWEGEGQRGQIRLIVVAGGFEHLLSTLYVQWVQAPNDDFDEAKVIRSMMVKETGTLLRLMMPQHVRGTRAEFSIEGIDTHTQKLERTRWTLTFGAPGVLRVREVRR